jgi:hypothetical protein
LSATLRPLESRIILNSAVPFGYNEGPLWAGRGLTGSVTGGVTAAVGPLSASIVPTMFQAQNAAFELLPNGMSGRLAYGFPYPWGADMPQRFGSKPYGRVDAGNSFVRLDALGLAVGFSTAAEHWGPARDHPIVLGNNAGGFPHAFLGTSHPIRLGPVRVHGRALWGRLSQSSFTFMDTIARHRFAPGVAFIIVPDGVPGLELGASRFAHVLWLGHVLSAGNLLRPFATLWNTWQPNEENQIASLFGRWVVQRAQIEVYAEFGREDANLDVRHFLQEPDHGAAYLLGFQKVWGDSATRRDVIRGEVLNSRITTPYLLPPPTPFYVHSPISQGHTHRGLALGSAGGFGGGAASLAFDRYTRNGRWTVSWTRLMRAEHLTPERGWIPIPEDADVFHAFGVDGISFRGRSAFTYELKGVYEVNRNFQRDVFNLRASSGVRVTW